MPTPFSSSEIVEKCYPKIGSYIVGGGKKMAVFPGRVLLLGLLLAWWGQATLWAAEYTVSEVRVVKWLVQRHGKVHFDYPYHWDRQLPLFGTAGDRFIVALDLVHFSATAERQVVEDHLKRDDFSVNFHYQGKDGTTLNEKLGSKNFQWVSCPWPSQAVLPVFEPGKVRGGQNAKAKMHTPAPRSEQDACLLVALPEQFAHAGSLNFGSGVFHSKLAIENIADLDFPQVAQLKNAPAPGAFDPAALVQYKYWPSEQEGEWLYVFGIRFWRPTQVAASWRPYTEGHWSFSPYGVVWNAATLFGQWAEHAGVWRFHKDYGWIVQSTYVWRPHLATFYARPNPAQEKGPALGRSLAASNDSWIAWRPIVPVIFRLQHRSYFPYRLGESYGFIDFPNLAERGWPANKVHDYVMVERTKFTANPIGHEDRSLEWIPRPAGRDVIMRPRDRLGPNVHLVLPADLDYAVHVLPERPWEDAL